MSTKIVSAMLSATIGVAAIAATPSTSRADASQFENAAKLEAASLLKDPSSAAFKNVRTKFDGRYYTTCGYINGRNGFGGVGASARFVVAQRSGMVRLIPDGEVHSDWSEYCQ